MKPGLGLLLGSGLLGLMALPLALGKVPPNRHYGFRPVRCPQDAAAWFRLNGFAGRVFLAVAGMGLLLGQVSRFLTPGRQVGFFLVLLLGAAVATWARTRLEPPGV